MKPDERKALAAALNPFSVKVKVDPSMPPDRVDFVDREGCTVGRIINLSKHA